MIEKTEGGFLISQIRQRGGRIFERLLNRAGVDAFNGAQGRILYVLWQSDQLPIGELAHRSGLAKTTLSGMLGRMEASGLVTRVPDPEDGRQTRIALTDSARELSGEYGALSRKMNEIYYAGFEASEVAALESALRRVLANLDEWEKEQ